jgi:hypothetical protein
MNPYLAKLRALEQAEHLEKADRGGFVGFGGAQSSSISESGPVQGGADGTEVGFASFVGGRSRPISESEVSKSASLGYRQNRQNPPRCRLRRILEILDANCPDHIEPERWRQAVEDGRRFLATWGEQAQALGWTARDLFGLHTPPENPHPSYRRLSRYDETGFIWLLEDRDVAAVTQETAAIRWPSGSMTTYRKNNKRGYGPLGDSLDDFQ